MGSESLPADTRSWLLGLARQAIAQALQGGGTLPPAESIPAGADELRGCFVTLHQSDGSLRGCIGTFQTDRPLWQAVWDMAVSAALRDPRFRPLKSVELDDCVLEISSLTPPRPARPEEVEVGRHGICVERGAHRGVLLPQVATERGWDRDTFLDHTCLKANLPADAWRDGSVAIEVFSAEVFGEAED